MKEVEVWKLMEIEVLDFFLTELVGFPAVEIGGREVRVGRENEEMVCLAVLTGFKRGVIFKKKEEAVTVTDGNEVLRTVDGDEIERLVGGDEVLIDGVVDGLAVVI